MSLKSSLLVLTSGCLVWGWGTSAIAGTFYSMSVLGIFPTQMRVNYGDNLYNESLIFQLDETGNVTLKLYGSCTYYGMPFFPNCEQIGYGDTFAVNDQGQGIFNGLPMPNPAQAYFSPGSEAMPQLIGAGLATDLNNQGLVTFNVGNNIVPFADFTGYNTPQNTTAYLWNSQNNSWLNLGQGKAFGVNDSGQVVGSFGLWDNGELTTLAMVNNAVVNKGYNMPIQGNYDIKQLRAINNQGQIVALAEGPLGTPQIVLLNPFTPSEPNPESGNDGIVNPDPNRVPEPSFLLGLLGISLWEFWQGLRLKVKALG
ncbi:hypothetical protein K4A83_12355 [Spirulina subsalsa FACHB-351]|uniref:PEP-CTERM sorting domain-containing protein n=1 Tax=Spirulina subsalsa FACHB-351 TaxID=234711 RepID=A0ABT3L6B9_9CYAN|nr:hypothetical protein [Spirulina subsalsa]MCW6037053.1 hypothetical protein [Spirulina subsalsa FACHB-351]